MNGSLNSGAGMCQGNARLLIKPVRAVIELGAAADVHLKTLKAVHHVNRHCSMMDYTAVAFPAMRMGRNCMLSGHEIELIGSGASLSRILKHDNVAQLKRRGMLIPTEVTETFMAAGETGAAYVRDRACEKRTPGWIRRSRVRAERRGKPIGKAVTTRGNDRSTLILRYGKTILHVRELVGVINDAPLIVSTYGFSSQNSPAILPVLPDSIREANDAT